VGAGGVLLVCVGSNVGWCMRMLGVCPFLSVRRGRTRGVTVEGGLQVVFWCRGLVVSPLRRMRTMHRLLLLGVVALLGWCAGILLPQFSGMGLLAVRGDVGSNLLYVALVFVGLVRYGMWCVSPLRCAQTVDCFAVKPLGS